MDRIRLFWIRILNVFRRSRRDRDIAEQIEVHRQMIEADLTERGMDPFQAASEARRAVGNEPLIRELARDQMASRILDGTLRDVRYGVRTLARNPGFATVAVLTLALGIGATSAMFSVVNGVLLRPLPYPDQERLVELVHEAPGLGIDTLFSSPAIYFGYRDHSQAFESVGHWDWDSSPVTVTGVGEPESVRSVEVTHEVLPMLGAAAILGRSFTQADDLPGGTPTVIISYGYWQRRFGGSDVLGETLVVEGAPRQVIGVLPQSFRFFEYPAEIFYPLQLDRSAVANFGSFDGRGIARERGDHSRCSERRCPPHDSAVDRGVRRRLRRGGPLRTAAPVPEGHRGGQS